jgi:hypothetical protein
MGIARNSALLLLAAAAMQLLAAAAAGKDDRDSGLIDASTVRAHMEFLASDALHGRGSGTRDEWITATYIAAQLRRSGLQPLGDRGDFVQTVQIDRTEVVGAPVLHIAPGTDIPGAQLLVIRLNAAAYHGPLQKYRAGVAVQPGAALLMPEDAVPGNGPELQSAGLVLWRETVARRARWSDLSARAITVGGPRIVGLPASPASAAASQIMLAADAYAAVAKLAEGSIATLTVDTREMSAIPECRGNPGRQR